MKLKKIIYGGIAATIGLLMAVVVFDLLIGLVSVNNGEKEGYAPKEILFGLIAEGIRGFILSYLYLGYAGKENAYLHALKFGILASFLVGSVWVILGYAYFGTNVLYETIIIIIQGIFSGLGLGFVYSSIDMTK